jgi:hypothetical protein
MFNRRRFKQSDSLEERLSKETQRLREKTKLLRPGAVREDTLRMARLAETTAHLSDWLRSPGLRPPA